MKYSLMLILLLSAFATHADNNFTIYLTRHAEKQKEQENPKLTLCGTQRAQQLASLLAKTKLKKIYSTQYNRTLATAQPTAKTYALETQYYSPAKLKEFAKKLLANKENALVVGHSNTTPQLAALLSGSDIEKISEKEYQNLYQIQISGRVKTVTLLTQPLTCY